MVPAREPELDATVRGGTASAVSGAGLTLYDNPFSPFTRKVRLVLRHKNLAFRSIDALALDELPRLAAVNARAEVPVLVHRDATADAATRATAGPSAERAPDAADELIVVESADIVAYLEERFPEPSVYPATPRLRAKARHWQRIADRVLDAILHDISLWGWPTHRREDTPPEGLLESGHRDLGRILDALERDLADFVCGAEPTIADYALFPHMPTLRLVGLDVDPQRRPRVAAWMRRLRSLAPVQQDLAEVRAAAEAVARSDVRRYEGEKVVWRGDRIEWLLANGFDAWWSAERASGRAAVPASL